MSTTSGRVEPMPSTASATLPATPTTSMPSPVRSPASASAKTWWSSHTKTRTAFDTCSSMQPETPPPDLRRELVGRLADGVAHDAANLLAVARLVGESLVTRDDLPADVVAKLTTLTKAVPDAGELLHQLSAVAGRKASVAHAVALDVLLDELTPLLSAALGGRPIEVSGSAVAFADRADIEAAVAGLVV